MSRQAEKYGYEQSETHEIAFWGLPITPPLPRLTPVTY